MCLPCRNNKNRKNGRDVSPQSRRKKGAVNMPAPQSGSPTYMLDGKQYIVAAIGGDRYSAELPAFRLWRA
jgi:hypothetical protein